jgi:hypothetical protein
MVILKLTGIIGFLLLLTSCSPEQRSGSAIRIDMEKFEVLPDPISTDTKNTPSESVSQTDCQLASKGMKNSFNEAV